MNSLYRTYIPDDRLKPYISSFAISESAEEKTYKVLPGTGLVIGFQYRGKLTRLHRQEHIPLSTAELTGLHDSYHLFKSSLSIGTVLIYFKETGAAHFFKQPIHELFRESVSLDNFMLRSELLIVEEQLQEATTDIKKIKVVERFLLARIRQVPPDSIVLGALAFIYKSKGTIRIKELTDQLHISQSPLEKRFRHIVGTSPKKFASIVRFKHIVQHYNPQTSLTMLGYDAGFYDQAHFIREFKTFTGETPETFFSKS